MILRRLPRQQAGLQATLGPIKTSRTIAQRTQTRSLHQVPQLRHHAEFDEKGVTGFLSPQGYQFSWLKYQNTLIQNLNRLTVDTPEESMGPKELLIHTSRWSDKAATFNYASMAFNNHFYFDSLHPNAPQPKAGQEKEDIMNKELHADICNSFSSLDTLKEEMLKTANAMFGPGFVWIVKEQDSGLLRLLTTYIAGSPFPAAHARRQPVDMNTVTTNVIGGRNLTVGDHNRRMSEIQNNVGSFGPYSRGASEGSQLAPGMQKNITPILCVKVWEHAWLYDYGFEPRSKSLYLERWWQAIDWEHVYQRTLDVSTGNSFSAINPAFRRPIGQSYFS